jgi:predicted phage replisome organizer
MAEVQWIKIYIDMFDKRKIKKLRRLPAGNELLLIWVMLLATAGKCNAGGMIYITENVPFTEEDLADELDFEVCTIRLALRAFEDLDMITTTEEGYISIMNWEEYQNVDKLAELRAKDRERKRIKRAEAKALLGNSKDVHGQSTEVPLLEEEIEEEIDKEEDKEYHSFIQSEAATAKMEYMNGTLGEGVVLMSEEQFNDLLDKLSLDELHKYFSVIVECEKNGRHYKKKSHYQAILDMAAKDRKVHK